jgi:hypothetical protein
VKVPVALLAKQAQVNNGLLDMAGGGWQNFSCASFPGPVAGWFCGLVEITDLERTTSPTFNFLVRDDSGAELARASGAIEAPAGDGSVQVPFAIAFSFVAHDAMLADFVMESATGEVLTTISLPVRLVT